MANFDEFNLLLLLPALCKEFTWQGNGYLAQQDAHDHELYLAIASAIQTSRDGGAGGAALLRRMTFFLFLF